MGSVDDDHADETVDEVATEVGTLDVLEDSPLSALALDRASIDMQVATAKKYPRSITKALKEAEEMACMDPDTAGSMFYHLPRGKGIDGPSVRLAEIMLYSWQNMRAEAGAISEDRKYVTAMGTAFDLERNIAVRITVKRRITDKDGNRYNDDMIGVTMNAATSIAFRNAVFKCIPASFSNRIYHRARRVSAGEGKDIDSVRTKVLDFFGQHGVKPDQVYKLVGVEGFQDLGTGQIITLRGIATAIRDGDTTIEQTFNPPRESEEAQSLDEALMSDDDDEVEKDEKATGKKAGKKAGGRSKKKAAEKKPEDPDLTEAIAKVEKKADALAKAGALAMETSEAVEEAVAAEDMDKLIDLDTELARLMKTHGVK